MDDQRRRLDFSRTPRIILHRIEPNRSQLIFHFSSTTEGPVVEDQDQEESKSEDPGGKMEKEQKPTEKCQKKKQQKGIIEGPKQKKHKKTHLDQNVYSCEFCHQIFSQKGNLMTHVRIHTGEKRFTCLTCGKSFTQKATMSSVQPKRKWINEQLTAAEETEFKEIIKSEEDMDNQRRPLDFSRIPMIILHRLDLPQCCVCKTEEVFTELSNQDVDFTLDQDKTEPLVIKIEQDEPEHLEIKHEQEEPEHLETKHEQEESEHLEIKHEQDEPEHLEIKHEQEEPEHLEIKHEQEEPEHLEIKHEQEEPEHLEMQLFKVEENQPFSSQVEEQLVLKQETGDILVTPFNGQRINNETEPNKNHKMLKKSHQDQNLFGCKICDKTFSYNSNLTKHMRNHSGEKSNSCKTSRKSLDPDFTPRQGKKLSSCTVCNRSFGNKNHTGEKTFTCGTCGKGFSTKDGLNSHMRIHTVFAVKKMSSVQRQREFNNDQLTAAEETLTEFK
ncbi:hypothetical protein CCH79_00014064 [Gambusia affinis]|uniref:C2H2-type domain-containing protein n=1 Tax=Gambusia affinis TaxID=33528 RepID=A0A315WAZ1_GAMAF|nr:hypothetical protein CCH79_00014064 [Gambusia affinis]